MDLCLIPPIPHLKQFKQKRHLVLSHLLQEKEYREHYEERRRHGDYLILDNSAHENGLGEGPGKLLLQALDLGVQELVVPDKLEDSAMTVGLARQALLSWYGSEGRLRGTDIRLMYVPQARGPIDWGDCLVDLMVLHHTAVQKWGVRRECTIGISKDYASWDGGLGRLLNYASVFTQRDYVEVHLLGSGHDYWSARQLAEKHNIRSIDTAKPFVWAMHGLVMSETGRALPAQLPGRPRNYFHTEFEDLSLAKHNAKVMKKMVEG